MATVWHLQSVRHNWHKKWESIERAPLRHDQQTCFSPREAAWFKRKRIEFFKRCGVLESTSDVRPARRGVFLSYWLNHLNAANSDPTSRKCGVVRSPHTCLKIPALHSNAKQLKDGSTSVTQNICVRFIKNHLNSNWWSCGLKIKGFVRCTDKALPPLHELCSMAMSQITLFLEFSEKSQKGG
jgi:hypothetical protein